MPLITVKLSNSAAEDISVVARGDFFLWLPGPDARHTIGKYEFYTSARTVPDGGTIAIGPNTTVIVYAKVVNEQLYGRILQQGECDICLHVHRMNGGVTFTENLPFTKGAIQRYYITADVGVD